MERSQSKYFHTAEKMDEALLELLDKHEFEFITVKAICEKAHVSRSTFYLHYETLDDILRETTEYVMKKFISYFSSAADVLNCIDSTSLENLFLVDQQRIISYLTFVKENQRLLRTVLRRYKTLQMDNVYDGWFQSLFSPILSRFGVPMKEHEYIIRFYLNGITAITEEWLKGNCSDSMEFISSLISKLVKVK